jgi:hypothetical protein
MNKSFDVVKFISEFSEDGGEDNKRLGFNSLMYDNNHM